MNNVTIAELQEALPLDEENYFAVFQQAAQNPSGFTGDTRKVRYDHFIDKIKSAVLEARYPIGSDYIQHPGQPTPTEKGLPGGWELWNHRVIEYELVEDNYPDGDLETYEEGGNYALNEYVIYHLSGSHTQIIRANKQITNAPSDLNPVDWIRPGQGGYDLGVIRIARRHLQEWDTSDFEIGDEIVDGAYAGYRVVGLLTIGGTFMSFAGGYRPTYENGVAWDTIRNIKGSVTNSTPNNFGAIAGLHADEDLLGPFTYTHAGVGASMNNNTSFDLGFDASRTVPVGTQNSTETISANYWIRIQ